MLHSTVSRVRLVLGALGFAVLGASLLSWAQALHSAQHRYSWVDAGASNTPVLDTAEIWQVSGNCVRPYFVGAALRSKARLKAYYDLAPEAVRARLNRSSAVPPSAAPKSWYRLVKDQPDHQANDDPDMEYSALLHVKYAEWYANVFKLEVDASRWQQRLIDVADRRLMLSESVRKSFGAAPGPGSGAPGATDDFDSQVLATLGLGGFPKSEEQTLKNDCVKISLVNKVLASPNYLRELWRWPVEQSAAFALALELLLLGIFLVPMMLWTGTGDAQLAAQHARETATRMAAKIARFDCKKRVEEAVGRLRTLYMATHAVLAELATRPRPGLEDQIVLFLRWVVLPGIARGAKLWERCKVLFGRHVGFQDAGHGLDLITRILRQAGADRTA